MKKTFSDELFCPFSISNDKYASKEIYKSRRAFDIAKEENFEWIWNENKIDADDIQHAYWIVQIVFK